MPGEACVLPGVRVSICSLPPCNPHCLSSTESITYQHDFRTFTAEIHRIGPAVQIVAFEGEYYASLVIGWMQSGDSTAVISKWEVDGL
jgi:hypothetical protein